MNRTGETRRSKTANRRGVLTFEWILLISLLVIGVIGGLSAVRNSLLCELNDIDQCIQAIKVCGCSGVCGSGDCTPYPECCDNPWWCWNSGS